MKYCKLFVLASILSLVECGGIRETPSNASKTTPTATPSQTTTPSVQKTTTPSVQKTTTPSVQKKTALEEMEIAFQGGFKKEEIKTRLETAMKLYELPITEENYSRAGSTLVALRQKNGTKEMDILSYMIRSHVRGTEIHFAKAAGISSAMLTAGDKR